MFYKHALRFGSVALVTAWMLSGCGQATTSNNRFQVGGVVTFDSSGNPVTNSPGGALISTDVNATDTKQLKYPDMKRARLDFVVVGPPTGANAAQNQAPDTKAFIQAQFQSSINTNVTFEIADLYYNPIGTDTERSNKANHVYATGTTAQSVDYFFILHPDSLHSTTPAMILADSPDPTQKVFTTGVEFPQSFNNKAPSLSSGDSASRVGTFDLTAFTYKPPSRIYNDPLHNGKPLDAFNLWIIPEDPTLGPNFITIHLNLAVAINGAANTNTIAVNTPETYANPASRHTLQFNAGIPGDGLEAAGPQVTWKAYSDTGLSQEYKDPAAAALIDPASGLFTAPVIDPSTGVVIAATNNAQQGQVFPSSLNLYIKAQSRIVSTIPIIAAGANAQPDILTSNFTYYTSVTLPVTKATGTISFH